MGLNAYKLVVIAIVLIDELVGLAKGDGSTGHDQFDIKTKFYTVNGNCVREIEIRGNGVTDSLTVYSCSDYGETILQKQGSMVYGHWPKDSFYLFSDKPSTLVIIQDGECKIVKYTGTEKDSSTMNIVDCKTVQKRIADLTSGSYSIESSGNDHDHTKNNQASVSNTWVFPHLSLKSLVQYWWIRLGKKNFDPNNFVVKTESSNENDDCVRTITIQGNGINEAFQVYCSHYDETIVRKGGAFLYGYWPKDTVYLFSNTFGTMIVFQDGECTKYTFTDTDTGSSPLGDTECSKVINQIEMLTSGSSWFSNLFKKIKEGFKFQLF